MPCTDPSGCERIELWVAGALGGEARRIALIGTGVEVYGLDWRRAR